VVPFFLLGSVLLTALGVGGMAWYNSLTKEQKEAADRKARDLAIKLFDKELGQLTPAEVRDVHSRLKAHFSN
jgi:hypothetical protein